MEETVVIPMNEYLQILLDEVGKERFQEQINRSDDFRSGALFGLSWAGCLTSQVKSYLIQVPDNILSIIKLYHIISIKSI